MRYLSSFYWQQEEPAATSLVLQQFVYRRGKTPGLFACLCTDRQMGQGAENAPNAYLAERLSYWFQTEGRELFRRDKNEECMETRQRLARVIAQADEDLERHRLHKTEPHKDYAYVRDEICRKPDLIGLLSMGERFLLFNRGEQNAYLLNRRFERVHCRCLTGQEKPGMGENLQEAEQKPGIGESLQLLSGEMETGIGLLLATEDFSRKLSRNQLEECLSVKEMERTENVKGRLRELGEEAARKGGQHMGTVLLLTRGGREYGV